MEIGWEGKEGDGPHGWSSPPCRVFFDSCDGFFTNYNWREEHLERMLGQAGQRRADVYVGVDVFARGKVVGGQFDTYKVGGGPRGWGGGAGCKPSMAWFSRGLSVPVCPQGKEEATFFPEKHG